MTGSDSVTPQASTAPAPLHVDLPLGKRLVDAAAMLVVAVVSLVLLIYVAFGETRRTYEKFQIDKLVAQGQVVQSSLESFVRPGLPVQQFVGFNQLAEPMVKADPLIDSIGVFDINKEPIFNAGERTALAKGNMLEVRKIGENLAILQMYSDVIEVALPLRNRFEDVGHIILTVPRAKVAERVEEAFKPLVITALVASVLFSLFVLLFTHQLHATARTRWVGGAFSAMFMIVSAIVVSTLISIYSQGAQARVKSLADSLGQRLDDLVIYNINLDDVTGIIKLFGDYKRLNPEIRAAALIVDGKVRAHVDPTRRDVPWDHVEEDYEYSVVLTPAGSPRTVEVKVALPRDIVLNQVLRSAKNFAALFVASAFMAALFMGVARSLQRLAQAHKADAWSNLEESAVINLVKPVFFLAVFVEHLSYAFLPAHMQAAAAAAKLPASFASVPFAAYYLMFALSLVPAGRLERMMGARNLILAGLTLAGLGLAALSLSTNFWLALGARGLSGVGQGVLFIGVQAYILANSSKEHRTQAGGVIVFGFQAGMIAGMAIGSLLVSYLGSDGVFILGAVIAAMTVSYGLMALPARLSDGEVSASLTSAWSDMWQLLRNPDFARSILLVGIPAKAILTGAILFSVPLLLNQQGFAKEDIGQITMVYAGAVILASHFAAPKVDRSNATETLLFYGTLLTALGLGSFASISLVNLAASPATGTVLVLLGVILVGFGHGCINAPVVTHVTQERMAGRVGLTNTAAAYRLMERMGHVIGPMILGQLFMTFGMSWTVLGWVGLAIFVMGALFLSPTRRSVTTSQSH